MTHEDSRTIENNTVPMSSKIQDFDPDESYRQQALRIIEEQRELFDALA